MVVNGLGQSFGASATTRQKKYSFLYYLVMLSVTDNFIICFGVFPAVVSLHQPPKHVATQRALECTSL